MSIFSDRLRISRETLTNYSQKEFAKKVNIAPNTYNGYETGNRMPNLQIVTLLADAIGVSVDYLLGRTNIRNFNDNNVSVDKEESSLIDDYKKLNSTGKKEAEKRVKELTLIPFYVEEKVVSLAAHNDHLDDPDEKEKILEDFDDMDKW